MDALSNFFSPPNWRDRVEVFLVHSVERLTLMRSGIFWTLSYVVLLALMYLFHSPFRAQVNTRTDWYAQLTKGLQIWLAVVLMCFHVGPHWFVERFATAAKSPHVSTASVGQRMLVEDTVASIFFPTFCFNSFFFLALHKLKRRWKLAFTYGPSLTLILINSVLLSMFATMHYTVCIELFSTVVPAVEASSSYSATTRLTAASLVRASNLICPQPVAEMPFACIAFLSSLCVLFVGADYAYKSWKGEGNPSRGILWAELYPAKRAKSQPVVLETADTSVATSTHLPCHWQQLRTQWTQQDLSNELGLRNGDPRLRESPPKSIFSQHRCDGAAAVVAGPEGWKDPHDALVAKGERGTAQPINRPGMVPWFSVFIVNTTWQAVARLALDFLTFDVRHLQKFAAPKIFCLHFERSLRHLPPLTLTSAKKDTEKEPLNFSATLSPPQLSTAGGAESEAPTAVAEEDGRVQDGGETREAPDVWFDWIADVGDGFNPTYAMARLLAQPCLRLPRHRGSRRRSGWARLTSWGDLTPAETPVSHGDSTQVLPRGSFVVVGGDLAYPTPDDETYTTRLFEPYGDALSENANLKALYRTSREHVVVPDAANADVAHIHLLDAQTVSAMAQGEHSTHIGRTTPAEALRSVPLLFAFPGNHDWFDGLATYSKYILEKTWIGGWLMPQRSSFFVLKLPYNWFMLCTDAGVEQDIDVAQRNYFLDVIDTFMDEESCVMLAAHEPGWIYDSMLREDALMQPQLAKVVDALGTRLRIRIAGDIHNYSRHVPRDTTSEAPMLVVSGGGGGFMHGPRLTPVVSQVTSYRRACAFPARTTLGTLLSRLLGFRVINWKFDLIIGVCCFMVVVSLLPQSIKEAHRNPNRARLVNLPEAVGVWWERTWMYVVILSTKGITSALASLGFFVAFTAAGAEKNAALWQRLLHGSVWTSLTVLICCGMLSYLLCTLEYMMDNHLLVSSKGHWGSAVEDRVRVLVDSLLNHTQDILGGPEHSVMAQEMQRVQTSLYGCTLLRWIGVFLRFLDPYEMLAYLSEEVSSTEMGTFAANAGRLMKLLYYLYFLFFYWILVTPLVSFVIGSYLLCSAMLFDCLYDATYSAFQIEEYKNFVRFKLDARTRELHAYVVSMKNVPKTWSWDAAHHGEITSETVKAAPPHLRAHPSRWNGKPSHTGAPQSKEATRTSFEEGTESGAEILEHFVCVPHYLRARE